MKEIRQAWYDLVAADGTIRGLTGYTAADHRIYKDNPPFQVDTTVAKPAHITHTVSTPGGIDMSKYVYGAQTEDVIIEVNVWADTQDRADDIAERLTVLLRDRHWDLTTYRAMTTDKEAEESIDDIHETTGEINFYRKYLRWRLRDVYIK